MSDEWREKKTPLEHIEKRWGKRFQIRVENLSPRQTWLPLQSPDWFLSMNRDGDGMMRMRMRAEHLLKSRSGWVWNFNRFLLMLQVGKKYIAACSRVMIVKWSWKGGWKTKTEFYILGRKKSSVHFLLWSDSFVWEGFRSLEVKRCTGGDGKGKKSSYFSCSLFFVFSCF